MLPERLDHSCFAALSVVQRRESVPVHGVDIYAARYQQPGYRNVVRTSDDMEQRFAVAVSGHYVRALVYEQLGHGQVALFHGASQRGVAVLVNRIDVGAVGE